MVVSTSDRTLAPRSAVGPLGPAIDRLERLHADLRARRDELRRLHAHLTAGHGAPLAELFDEVEAVLGAHLAKESRVIVPYLRGLERGRPERGELPSLDLALPILTGEHKRLRDVVATLGARLAAIADVCAACAVAYTTALHLATALSGHRTFGTDTLYPLALARERQLASAAP